MNLVQVMLTYRPRHELPYALVHSGNVIFDESTGVAPICPKQSRRRLSPFTLTSSPAIRRPRISDAIPTNARCEFLIHGTSSEKVCHASSCCFLTIHFGGL